VRWHDSPFLLEQRLSTSALAEVFSGTDTRTGRAIIVKRARGNDRDTIVREYTVLAHVASALPGSVPEIVADGLLEPSPWFATARIAGSNFREFQHKYRIEQALSKIPSEPSHGLCPEHIDTVLTLAVELAATLSRVHALGVVHGDLTPDNILVSDEGRLVLVDFENAQSSPHLVHGVSQRATPGYAAPEALRGESIDSRADMYAWACIVRELLLGQPLFFGATAPVISRQHLEAVPPPASTVTRGVPDWLDELLLGLLAKEPRQRRPSACSVVWSLERRGFRPPRSHERGVCPPLNHPGFVGRHVELRVLAARLEAAAAGSGGVLLLLGASGTGKSMLLRELARLASTRGFCVVQGTALLATERAGAGLRRAAALPRLLVERLLAERPLAAWSAEESLAASALRAWLPDDVARDLAPADAAGLPPAVLQRRAFRALAVLASALGSSQPLLVVLDDLDEDELATAFLGSREARALAAARVSVIAAGRSPTLPALDDVRTGALEAIELGGLDRPGTLRLVGGLLGVEQSCTELAGFLHEHCAGNPRCIGETLQLALDRRLLGFDPDAGWSLPEPAALAALSRAALEAAATGPLAALGSAALSVAVTAAPIGRSFELEELRALIAEDGLDLPAALRELIQNEVLTPEAEGYRFSHEHLRAACERQLSVERRRALHARVAERWSARFDANEARAGEIGRHWLLAGQLERALPCLLRAAGQFEQALEPLGAIRALEPALDALRAQPAATDWSGAARELAQRLLELYARTAQHGPLRALAEQIVQRVAEADWPLRFQALVELGRSQRVTSDYGAATRALDQAERLLRRARKGGRGEERRWLDLQEQRIWLAYMKGDTQGIGPLLQRMAPIVRSRGSPKQLAAWYMWSANDLTRRNRYQFSPTAVAEERRGVALLQGADALPELAMAEFDLAFMLLLGDVAQCEEALGHLRSARSLAERLCDPVLAARAATYLAIGERRCGRTNACDSWARVALEEARLSGIRGYAGAAQACLGWVAWRREEVGAALQRFGEAQQTWWHRRARPGQRLRDEYPFQWLAHLPLLAIHWSRDELEAARAAIAELLAESQKRLDTPLYEPLVQLDQNWDQLSPRESARLIDGVIRQAAELGYV
jgi:hypothetical protein